MEHVLRLTKVLEDGELELIRQKQQRAVLMHAGHLQGRRLGWAQASCLSAGMRWLAAGWMDGWSTSAAIALEQANNLQSQRNHEDVTGRPASMSENSAPGEVLMYIQHFILSV